MNTNIHSSFKNIHIIPNSDIHKIDGFVLQPREIMVVQTESFGQTVSVPIMQDYMSRILDSSFVLLAVDLMAPWLSRRMI